MNEMKKILIFTHAMEIGGVERALIGFLENIDTSVYQVDLFLMRHTGPMLGAIPSTITLLPEIQAYTCLETPIQSVLKKKEFGVFCGRIKGKLNAKIMQKKLGYDNSIIPLEYSHKYTRVFMPQISNKNYDLAISFMSPHYFVAEKVHAEKKAAWIHTDYAYVNVDKESELKMWDKYDHIISISPNVTQSFLKTFPSLKNKIRLIENIIPQIRINQEDEQIANQEMSTHGEYRLLSVGRFCEAKNFDNVPAICKLIVEAGVPVKWFLIGYGGDELLIRQKIIETGMEDHVIILGKKENPYPYMKYCDLYVQPSRYEGKCVSVLEAQILHKPVVITNYATSSSQIRDGEDGIIVPMDNAGCAKGIIQLLRNKQQQRTLSENTKLRDYTNASEISKIYKLID